MGSTVLPVAGTHMSAVEIKHCLYALGGWSRRELDTVQKLSLDSLTWELMQLKLPQADCYFACFKTDTQVCLVIKETLYSFTFLQVKPVKTLDRSIVFIELLQQRHSLLRDGRWYRELSFIFRFYLIYSLYNKLMLTHG
jgi:hypothetical protein